MSLYEGNPTTRLVKKSSRWLETLDEILVPILAEGLKELLSPEFELLGIVKDGRELVEEAKKLRPDVIVADVSMPDLNRIDALSQLKKNDPRVKVEKAREYIASRPVS